jgi:hypothetical protein
LTSILTSVSIGASLILNQGIAPGERSPLPSILTSNMAQYFDQYLGGDPAGAGGRDRGDEVGRGGGGWPMFDQYLTKIFW